MRSQEDVEYEIKRLESDERLSYPLATVEVNAPLALIQTDMEARLSVLRWVLQGKEEGCGGENDTD